MAQKPRRSSSTDVRKRRRSNSRLISGHPSPEENSLKSQAKRLMDEGSYEEALSNLNKLSRSPDITYKRSICLMKLEDWRAAFGCLQDLMNKNPGFSKDIYPAIVRCLLALDDINRAIKCLTKGLQRFPSFFEGFRLRGQLFLRQKKFEKAIPDFSKAIDIASKDTDSFLGMAEALIGLGDLKRGISILKKAGAINTLEGLIKRGALYYSAGEYRIAVDDLNQALNKSPGNPDALYYKAMVLYTQDDLTEAALCLEQVIKHDQEKRLMGSAIYNLGAIQIKQCDFYGASSTFQRASGVAVPEMSILQLYVEGVLNLMKRHFSEAVDQLTKIIKKKHPLLKDYLGKCFACRAFAYASLNKHEEAMKDLERIKRIEELDLASEYNLLVSKGALNRNKDTLEEARAIFPNNIEPLLYQSAILFRKMNYEDAFSLLAMADSIKQDDSDLHFFRGIIKYAMGNSLEAISDIEYAIEKAEDNISAHYLAKGVCYGFLKMYKEAIQDFSIVLQLDESSEYALKYRGRCYFLLENTTSAFSDYQKLVLAHPEDPMAHILAGDLLMMIGSVEDAIEAYCNANETEETELAYIQQAKCHLLKSDLDKTAKTLLKAYKKFPEVEFDKNFFNILVKAHNKEDIKGSMVHAIAGFTSLLKSKSQGKLSSKEDAYWLRGVLQFYTAQFAKAKESFEHIENDEAVYNKALCCVMNHSYEEALMDLHTIVLKVEGKDRGKLLLLMGLLQIGLRNAEEAKELITEGYKFDSESVNSYLDESSEVKILPLRSSYKFASSFPMAKLSIADCKPILIRPSFAMPSVEMPGLEFTCQEDIVNLFDVMKVKCKPEPPWLNRVGGTIQFTTIIHDIPLDSESSEEEIVKKTKVQDSEKEIEIAAKKNFKSASDLPDCKRSLKIDDVRKYEKNEMSSDDSSSDLLEF